MADDVTITFTADVSDLQQGMQQATSAVEATTSALRSGAAQINSSFASLSQAYGSAAAKNIATVRTSSDTELAIARQSVQAQYDIASNGVKEQVSLVKEQAQTGQISRQQELSSLLALETQREDIERQYLQFVQNTYQQGTVAYAAAQRRIDELASQSALRRQEIERNVTQQIDADYKRSFDQIASSVSSSIMGMITSHQSLKQSAIEDSRPNPFHVHPIASEDGCELVGRPVSADNGDHHEPNSTDRRSHGGGRRAHRRRVQPARQLPRRPPSAACFTASWPRRERRSRASSDFSRPSLGQRRLAPLLPARHPCLPSRGMVFAMGAWSLPSDMIVQVHRGEMVIPAGVTPWAQGLISGAANTPGVSTVHVHHATNFNVAAMDSQGVKQFLKNNSKQIMRTIDESVRTGSHIGLAKLRTT